jgi:hypothetical protein
VQAVLDMKARKQVPETILDTSFVTQRDKHGDETKAHVARQRSERISGVCAELGSIVSVAQLGAV